MKPSLHELISKEIYGYIRNEADLEEWLAEHQCDYLAEQIIKIIRDYHLVEETK